MSIEATAGPAAPDVLFARWRTTGDAAALGRLFDATASDLFRIASTMTRDAATAEDAVQETFLAALEFAPRWDASRPVVPWLVGILRHKVEDLRRRGRRTPEPARLAASLPPLDPSCAAEAREDAERLRAAMDLLPEPWRQAALLRWRHGLEPSEIAHLTRKSPGAIRVRLHRALARLRARLREGAALALLAGPETDARGLGAVRDAVLRHARSPSLATTAAAAAGGVLVGKKLAAAAAVAVALLAGGAAVTVLSRSGGGSPSSSQITGEIASATSPSRGPQRAARPEAAAATAEQEETPRAPDAGGVAFVGRVLLADGRPAADVEITASALRPWQERGGARAPDSAVVRTRKDGSFEVRLPAGTPAADLVATARGCATASIERVQPGSPVEIRLDEEGVLVGRVTDAAATPIAGALLRLVRARGHEHAEVAESRTDSAGEYRFGGFSGDERRTYLYAQAEGFGTIRTWRPFPSAGETVRQDLVLPAGRPLTVRVLDADTATPLAGATVTLGMDPTGLQIHRTDDTSSLLPHPAPYFAEGTTNAEGLCVLSGAPAAIPAQEQVVVRAWRKGHVVDCAILRERPAAAEEPTVLRLWPAATVTGRVVDTEGRPVARAGVFSAPSWREWIPAPIPDFPWNGVVRTDADGRYSYPCVRASAAGTEVARILTWGSQSPDAEGRVYAPANLREIEIRARPGETFVAPDLVLDAPRPPLTASVVVVDEAGAPVAGAAFTAPGSIDPEVRTSGDGRATLRWWSLAGAGHTPPGSAVIEVRAAGFARTVVRVAPSPTAAGETRVTLSAPRRIEGRVRLEDDRPVAGAEIYAGCDDDGAALSANTTSGADGTFVLEGLPPRPFRVVASAGDRWQSDFRSTEAKDVVPGGAPVMLTLPPDRVARGTVTAEVVSAEDGAPLIESQFEVVTEPRVPRTQSSPGSPGVFRVTNVPAGTWSAWASAPGRLGALVPVTVAAGETARLRLALPRGTALRVRVTLPEDAGLRVEEIVATRVDVGPDEEGAGREFRGTISEGVARFDALPPGTFRLRFDSMTGFGMPPQVHLAGTETLVVLPPAERPQETSAALRRCGSLAVAIEDRSVPPPPRTNAPKKEGTLEFLGERGERHRVILGIWRGRGTPAVALPAGNYTVRLVLPDGRVRTADAVVRTGEKTIVTFAAE